MGGAAFPNYDIPRLTPEQYATLRDRIIALLQAANFYGTILCPPAAPGKTSHGDVDLLASSPTRAFTADDLSAAVGAVSRTKTGPTTSFCIPLPPAAAAAAPSQQQHAQLDIHVVADPALLPWTLFSHSYGDLFQLLGRLQRPLGLTATDRGLHLRVAAIEPRNRRAAMLFLSREPGDVMGFLGLDADGFGNGFDTEEDVFRWVAKGRFFAAALLGRGKEEAEGGASAETANDRARVAKRVMFARFVREWAPSHPEAFGAGDRVWSREEVLEEALKWFGEGVRERYEEMVREHEGVVKSEALMERIKAVVPVESDKIGIVLKGVKRWVGFVDGKPLLKPEDEEVEAIGGQPEWIRRVRSEEEDGVVEFVREHWEVLLLREKRRASDMKAGKGRPQSNLIPVAGSVG